MSSPAAFGLHAVEGGSGGRRLVLLHGIGTDAGVWRSLTELVDQRWLAPDLRGHGRSPHAPPYGYASFAADVADLLDQDEEVVVVGHSMGGYVGAALASGWFGVRVAKLIGIGVKVRWSDDERAQVGRIAAAPAKVFERQEDAVARYLRVSGLEGLVAPTDPVALGGVREGGDGWTLAADPRLYAAVTVDFAEIARSARCPVRMGAGERDAMAPTEDLRSFDPDPFTVEGAGHNVHIERPGELWDIVERELRSLS